MNRIYRVIDHVKRTFSTFLIPRRNLEGNDNEWLSIYSTYMSWCQHSLHSSKGMGICYESDMEINYTLLHLLQWALRTN